jgi:hypothetical protein
MEMASAPGVEARSRVRASGVPAAAADPFVVPAYLTLVTLVALTVPSLAAGPSTLT